MACFVILFGVVAIIMGLLFLLAPHAAWSIVEGWKYQQLEPSEWLLFSYRLRGIVGMLVGVGLIVMSYYMPSPL
jgi:hypothetical protein